MIKIGNVAIEKTAALAPMASVADTAYRTMCKKFGACYVVGEMVSVKGLYFSPQKALDLLSITPKERPMAIQLFGSQPKYFEYALPKVLESKPDIIDINMGCPVPKVVKTLSGCMLMKNPELAEKIAKCVVKNSPVPVTVKIRKGWDENNVNAVEFSKRMQNCGISAITIHGRTKTQMYSGKSDWEFIAKVKNSLDIPVIANGDVYSPESAKKMYDVTGADLIMIGRGSFGRPWIFSQIASFLKTGRYDPAPPLARQMQIMLEHIRLICDNKGENLGMKQARAQAIKYFRGIKGAARYREICSRLTTFSEIYELVKNISNDCYLNNGGF